MRIKGKMFSLVAVASGLAILAAVFIGVRAFNEGNLAQARQIASRLQADSAAAPAAGATSTSTTAGKAAASGASTTSSSTAHRAAGANVAVATAGGVVATAHVASAPVVHPATTTAPSTTVRAPTTTSAATAPTPSVAPIVTPTSAEVQQAIDAVHDVVPFFTPTPAQIASAGIEVCTSINAGDSLATVEAAALNMVGAGSLSSLVPSSDTAVAIQTLVALYCPANASKVG